MKNFKMLRSWKLRSSFALLSLFAAGKSEQTFAQSDVARYVLTQSTETYTPINGGTVLVAASTPFDNEISPAITIPSFTFGGVAQTTMYVSANGFVTFGGAPNSGTYTPLSSSVTGVNGVVAGFAADLGYGSTSATPGAVSEIRHELVGNEYVVQYTDVKRWASANERISFQIRLNTSNGVIKVRYAGPIVIGSSTTNLQVGLRGNNTTWTSNVNSLTTADVPAGTTCDWSHAVTGNANSSTMYMNPSAPNLVPTEGLTFTWTPATSPAPVRTFAAVSGIMSTQATLSWTASTGAVSYNIRYRTSGSCTWTNAAGNPFTSTTATLTGLTPFTTYQVQVQAVDGANTSIWSHIPNQAGSGNGYTATGTFTTLATCVVPTNISNTAVNSGGATVRWNNPAVIPAGGFEYYVSTSNTAPTAATVPTGSTTDTFKVLTGLPSSTQHYVWVRSYCTSTDQSIWTASTNFTTTCVPPTPGATVSTSGSYCMGQPITLTVANPLSGGGLSYLWQSSTDGTNYTNITGATNNSYATNVSTLYYRARVVCNVGPDTAYSAPLQMTLANSVVTTAPGQRCGAGTVSLGATGNPGTTIYWYENATGGIPLGTVSPFTTPYITSTTDFYAEAVNVTTGFVRVGNGTTSLSATSFPNPLSAWYGATKTQMLFRASELWSQGLSSGNITSIAVDVTNFLAAGVLNDFTIRMDTTSLDVVTGIMPVTNTVYNATYTPNMTGIVTFNFTTPFNWDGVSNIVLETAQNSGNGGNGSGTRTAYTATAFNSVYTRAIDNITPATVAAFDAEIPNSTAGSTNISANRPNIIFGGQSLCRSARTAVTATVNIAPAFTITEDKTVCNNGVTTLAVTSPATDYNVVNWTPDTHLYTDAAATVPYVAGSNFATVYHKSSTAGTETIHAIASNTTSGCGNIDTVVLQVLPAAITATALPGKLCNSGSSTLVLSPAISQTGFTYQWQNSSDNSAFANITGATGASYTTPVITATQYYRATVKNSAGVSCFNSSSDTVLVNVPAVTATTPATRCGTGTLTLAATANAGYSIKWYTTATGGTPVGTSSNYTTPSISTTTTYYVSAGTGASGNATLGSGAYTTVSGSPSYSGVSPYAYHYGNYKRQMLVTAAELTAQGVSAGDISSLAFDVVNAGSPVANFNNFSISLLPTSNTAMTAAFIPGATPVYSAASVTPSVGLNTYNFTTPFNWDGVSNIIVQVCYNNNNSGAVASSAEVKYDTTSFTSHTIFRADGTQNAICDVANGGTGDFLTAARPKMVFGHNSLCESGRTPVVATINASPTATLTPNGTVSICNGQPQTLTGGGGGTYTWLENNSVLAGQTSNTLVVSTANTYKVVVTNANGCKDTSAAAVVNISNPPTVNIGNDTAICEGSTFTLDAGNPGATYVWSNAAITQTIAPTTSGTYYVAVTGSNNCIGRDTMELIVNPLPVVSLGSDTGICEGSSLEFDVNLAGASYLWDDASTAATRTIDIGGTFYVAVTDANECTAHDTIEVVLHTLPIVDLGDDLAICEGTPHTLDAGNPGATYIWDDASNNQTRDVSTAGDYYVEVTDDNGCVNADSVTLTIVPLPSGDMSISDGIEGTYDFSVDNAQNVTNAAWDFGDGNTGSGLSTNHTYSDNGTYTISLTLFNECGDSIQTTREFVVSTVGIRKLSLNQKQLSVYPNPATTILNITNQSGYVMQHVTVINILGQVLYQSASNSGNSHQINISTLAAGIYTLKIETNTGTVTRKFEVLR